MKPIDYLSENQKLIFETYCQYKKNKKNTWQALIEKLPKLSQVMKYNTFKQYMTVHVVISERVEIQKRIETEKLRQVIEEKDVELKTLNSELMRMNELISKPEKKAQNIDGWTIRLTSKGYYNLCKSFGGKVESIYIGKKLNVNQAKEKISERMNKLRQKGLIK